jgi:AcrR family transcriptional regulator
MPERPAAVSHRSTRRLRRAGTRGMPRADRERLILDVAGTVFARDGYHAASMEEIAATADVSKPMLYAYFASKDGLYRAYINRTGRELVERLVGAAGPGGARLRATISEFLAFVEEYRAGWTVLFHEITASQPLAEEVAQLRGQVVGAVCRMLQAGGECRDGSAADGIAHAIVGAGESIANWWLAHPTVPRADVTEWYVGLVQSAVARRLPTTAP